MYQIHCPNCNSNRVDVTGKEIWLMLGIVLGVPGLILLFFTVRHHTTLLFIGLPLCLFALVNIYRFAASAIINLYTTLGSLIRRRYSYF
jgi:uncharacterized membrane protein YccC